MLLSFKNMKKISLKYLLTTPKTCIAAMWKQTDFPIKQQWYARIDVIQRIEKLTMTMRNQEEKFFCMWMPWFLYADEALSSFRLFPLGSID